MQTVKLAIAVAAIALVAGGGVYVISWHKGEVSRARSDGMAAGKAEVMQLWQAEAIESARDDAAAARARQQIVDAKSKDLQAANERALQAEEQLRRARDERNRAFVSPATVTGCASATAAGDALDAAGAGPRVYLNWGWVRDYDAAWTGAAGESLFGDRPGAARATQPAGSPSPYGLAEVSERHAGNAAKCSRAIRQLNELIDVLDALEAQEGARLKGEAQR